MLAGLGSSLGKAGIMMAGAPKQKEVKYSLPSVEDYRLGMASSRGLGFGSVLGAGGQYYYGAPPEKGPAGMTVVAGPSISIGQRDRNRGSYTKEIPTYQLVPTAGLMQPMGAAMPTLDTSLGKAGEFGVKDLKAARAQGLTRKEIREAAERQGVRLGAKAKARLYKEKKNKEKKEKK